MRWPIAVFLGSVFWTMAAAAEQTFPYKAYVTADDVYVRSGPGENYYPTDKLKAGQEVEIYRHDPGGWYAIRPPAGSFSWVSGRHLQLDKDGLATVTEDRVAARVGSRFSDVRDVIQVRLQRGEVIELLDGRRAGAPTAAAAATWYKIAPPSGEFRWVFGRFVDPDFARDGLRRSQGGAGAARPAAPTGRTVSDRGPAGGHLSAEQLQTEIGNIDVELSTMVAEEPTVWDFGPLRQRVESLLDQAETAVDRGRARVLLNKIARFEDIRQRYNTLAAAREQLARADRRLARLGRSGLPTDPDGRFDAVGRLAAVRAPKPGAPQYAVMDDQGNIRCYVSPAPGINLRYYVGQQVGINGTRGYMPQEHANHVMARHISIMDPTNSTMLR